MSSPYRTKILELFDEGLVGKDELFLNLLNWISESDAREFWNQLEFYDVGGFANLGDFHPQGQSIFALSKDKKIHSLVLANSKSIASNASVRSLVFLPNGQSFAGICDDKTLKIWNINNGNVEKEFVATSNALGTVAFSPNNQLFVLGGVDSEVRIYQTGDQKLVASLKTNSGVRNIQFQKENVLAVAGEDGSLVRLTRGKPSPFWTIVLAAESAEGQKAIGDDGKVKGFEVVQVAAEREDKPAKAKAKSAGAGKAAKSKGISEDDINALVVAQVCEYTRDLSVKLDSLTDLVKSLIAKVDSLQGVQATVSQPLSDDSEKAIADAKLEAVEDMRKVSEEFASICTTL